MKILALESSAVACSVCLTEDEELIAEAYENSGLTHSVTLLPMAEEMLKNCGVKLEDVDVVAVAAGPGSFTGLRIGVSAAKGNGAEIDYSGQALRQGLYFGSYGMESGGVRGEPLPCHGR